MITGDDEDIGQQDHADDPPEAHPRAGGAAAGSTEGEHKSALQGLCAHIE